MWNILYGSNHKEEYISDWKKITYNDIVQLQWTKLQELRISATKLQEL